jgi:hypothetical protein
LFSLAARLLGAQVRSFDYDVQSVACTRELKRRYFDDDEQWRVESGSILDAAYVSALGQYDVVYSWGVLHHTGRMCVAMENAARLVNPGGQLFIALYNRQPFLTPYWTAVKRFYNRAWPVVRALMNFGYFAFYAAAHFVADVARGRSPALRYRGHGSRGMTLYYDIVDWIGGWPFEVASPEEVFRFYQIRGYQLTELVTCGGKHGCNEFVFRRPGTSPQQ